MEFITGNWHIWFSGCVTFYGLALVMILKTWSVTGGPVNDYDIDEKLDYARTAPRILLVLALLGFTCLILLIVSFFAGVTT